MGATEFRYSSWEANEASKGLAKSLGFQLIGSEKKTDGRNGQHYVLQKYFLKRIRNAFLSAMLKEQNLCYDALHEG